MKIFKSTVFSAVCALAACSAFAQQAPTAVAKAAEKPAAEKPAQDEDRSYLADYADKPASVALFDEKTKSENVVAFKEVKDDSVVFIGGGGEIPISKKKPSSQKIVVKVDNNWLRIRTALGRENWEEAIVYMRPFVYPLIPLMCINEDTFKGNAYLEMYLNVLVNAKRMKEAVSIADSLKLGDCAPSLVSSVLGVAEALAKSGDVKGALAIVDHVPYTGIYTQVIPDFLSVLAELRKAGAVKECAVYYTKLTAVESAQKNEAVLWMVYCDLSMGKKMSAEIYLNQIKLDKKAPEFSLLKMNEGMLAEQVAKPDLNTVLDHYAEGIVFGSLTSSWMPELLYKTGMAYKKLGRQYAANEIFAQMASLFPNDTLTAKGQKEIVKVERKPKKVETDDDDDDDDDE